MRFQLASALEPSGLLGELLETTRPLTGTYYGYNVTKTNREPIDQIHGFIAASRLSKASGGVPFIPFVAGLFEVVNAASSSDRTELIARNTRLEMRKAALFQRILDTFGLQGHVLTTDDMWNDARYWASVAALLGDKNRFSRKTLLQDTLKWYANEDAVNATIPFVDAMDGFAVPASLLDRFGSWPAPLLYTPLEVAEAMFLQEAFAVSCKIGHMEERVYDKYIMDWMDLVHLRQPVDLKSTFKRARGVTPYIDKERRDRKLRLYFEDAPAEIASQLAEVTDMSYLRTISATVGELYHPFVDKAVLAVEAGIASGEGPISVAGARVHGGRELLRELEGGSVTLEALGEELPDLISRYINVLNVPPSQS